MSDIPETPRGFASPPCYLHEIDPDYAFGSAANTGAIPVAEWRKAERERLIAARRAVPLAERVRIARDVAFELERLVDIGPDTVVSGYWPFRGELDLRAWLGSVTLRGGRAAMPVVVQKAAPLRFRDWAPGAPMAMGHWNIPIPAEGEEVVPTVVISPLVGHDAGCYRLGYGGGYFDRTLAALAARPLVIGVGLPLGEIPTIRPQPHDIPMDVIVTGRGQVRRRAA